MIFWSLLKHLTSKQQSRVIGLRACLVEIL
uniref:Uncharacterized protein n=1 Tax=Arundo donax TaxID=35708 RepID=A0A0A8YDF9_ARUDO